MQEEWLGEARAWIAAECERHGERPTGEIEQPHVEWWSTVLRVPTSAGDLWFKAAAPAGKFEAGLVELLARLRPSRVPELVASDPERGWMLMRDGGTRLRELIQTPGDTRRWEDVLPAYADVQLAAAPLADELLALGVPDSGLDALPGLLAGVLDDESVLLLGHPDGLTAAERDRLRRSVPEFEALCRELTAYGVPETVQHDDLHDGNVFLSEHGYVGPGRRPPRQPAT